MWWKLAVCLIIFKAIFLGFSTISNIFLFTSVSRLSEHEFSGQDSVVTQAAELDFVFQNIPRKNKYLDRRSPTLGPLVYLTKIIHWKIIYWTILCNKLKDLSTLPPPQRR